MLGPDFWASPSADPPREGLSASDEDKEALTGTTEVLNVESPPMLRYLEILLDVSDDRDE